jgi:hypothetical protein
VSEHSLSSKPQFPPELGFFFARINKFALLIRAEALYFAS